jgi:septum formation protein
VLVLASSSPYRRSLLERLKLPFSTASPDVDESALDGERPHATALRLAENKARAIAGLYPDAHIIGSDQVAVLDGKPLGKPQAYDAALTQLLAVRGRSVAFHTAVCLLDARSGQCRVEDVPTTVHFRHYTLQQAVHYLEIEKPYDCAGSAKIESLGIALVERVESTDPTALIGLPLIALVTMLEGIGVEIL